LHWIAEILHAKSCVTALINLVIRFPVRRTVQSQYMRYRRQQTDRLRIVLKTRP